MPNRTAKFVSAIIASVVAGAALATIPHGAARAADDCLSGPKGRTPEGGHWYYRIDHAAKRHCWYLGEEREKLSQIAPPISSPPAKPVATKAETAAQRSIADAHAELPAQTDIEPPNRSDAPIPAIAADATVRENNAGADAQRSVVASRWPEPSGMSSAVSPPPAARNLAANAEANSAAAPPPAAAAVPLAAPDASPQSQSGSIPMLLSVIAGALALAGIIAGVILKSGGARRPRQARVRPGRATIWQPTDDDSIALSAHPGAEALPRRTGFARDLDRTDDANDRVAESFSRLSRRAPT